MPPDRCDVILKGGITSGVVYPTAIVELSKRFRFVNVGGSSAGAIAAALTAAAEYARVGSQPGATNAAGLAEAGFAEAGFARLAKLPEWFRTLRRDGRSNLLALFQPSPHARRVFAVLTAALNAPSLASRLRRGLLAALPRFPARAVLVSLPGLAVAAVAALSPRNGLLWWVTLGVGLLLAALGFVAGTMWGVVRDLLDVLPRGGFGLCPGLRARGAPPDEPAALTEWLAAEINLVAGRAASDPPLTLGDLKARDVHLVVMTTNLTHGRPYTIPFKEQPFAFSPTELRALFPEAVVAWLEAHARTHREPDLEAALERRGLRLLPTNDELPVVFAARLSLSFPGLISAVPLWTFDFTRDQNRKTAGVRPDPSPERCWFSDGGIGSNFPLHFFDGPIPRWPTFAINLRPFHPDHPRSSDERRNVWRADTNGDGLAEAWNRFASGVSGSQDTLGFLGAILGTMHEWHDNALLTVPGYRDRIVHVSLDDSEGGLNLNMPPHVLDGLAERGAAAGRLLAEAFGAPSTSSARTPSAWDNQRWVRLRTILNLLEELHGRMTVAFPYGSSPTYQQLLGVLGTGSPYPWSPSQRQAALAALQSFLALWPAPPAPLLGGEIPRPVPFLTVTPPTGMPPRP